MKKRTFASNLLPSITDGILFGIETDGNFCFILFHKVIYLHRYERVKSTAEECIAQGDC